MKLNCDLGEGLDDIDKQVMPFIHMANIACGGHAGDNSSMARTVQLALEFSVTIGAHPSYPDRENFGRKSLSLPQHELLNSLIEQVQALVDAMAGFDPDTLATDGNGNYILPTAVETAIAANWAGA